MHAENLAQKLVRRPHEPNKLVSALLAFGITETQLGQQLGCTQQLCGLWARGERTVTEQWKPGLYRLLGEVVASRQQTIELIKQQGKWDAGMRRLVNARFREAEKMYRQRPSQYREDSAA